MIIDIFLNFAKYVQKDGVLKLFTARNSILQNEYLTLKSAVENLEHETTAEKIPHFMFGISREIVAEFVKSIKGRFLYVEYGQVTNIKPNTAITDSIQLAVTIAEPFNHKDRNIIEEAIISNNSLSILTEIIDNLKFRQNEYCLMRELVGYPINIIPIDSTEFFGCVGWTAFINQRFVQK